jgi:mannosyltransferase
MKKQIYFDTTFLHYGDDLRGIPQVIFQLIRLFLSSNSFSNILFIATTKVRDRFLLPLGVKTSSIETIGLIPLISRDIRFHGLLCGIRYGKIKRQAAFIIHPEYRTVVKKTIPQLVIFHDFIFLNKGDKVTLKKPVSLLKYCYRAYIRMKCSAAVQAKALVTVSEYTKSCLVRHFPFVPSSSVSVLYNGIRFSVPEYTTKSITVNNPLTLLSVGGLDEARKNIRALLLHLPDVVGKRPFIFHLIGKCPEKILRDFQEIIDHHGYSNSVIFPGVISNEDLHQYYERAQFLLLPSLSEGFGLPLIEAMAHGCVACAFNNTSIPEIGGDATILSDNNNFKTWGKRIGEILENPSSFMILSKKAQEQAQRFSEENMLNRYRIFLLKILQLEQKG